MLRRSPARSGIFAGALPRKGYRTAFNQAELRRKLVLEQHLARRALRRLRPSDFA